MPPKSNIETVALLVIDTINTKLSYESIKNSREYGVSGAKMLLEGGFSDFETGSYVDLSAKALLSVLVVVRAWLKIALPGASLNLTHHTPGVRLIMS